MCANIKKGKGKRKNKKKGKGQKNWVSGEKRACARFAAKVHYAGSFTDCLPPAALSAPHSPSRAAGLKVTMMLRMDFLDIPLLVVLQAMPTHKPTRESLEALRRNSRKFKKWRPLGSQSKAVLQFFC